MTRRILVTGASGFLGRPLTLHLAQNNIVRAASRNAGSPTANVEPATLPDLARDIDWTPLLDGVDVVIHLAAIAHTGAGVSDDIYDRVNHRATASLAQAAARAGVSRFVFLSSIRAQTGATTGHVITEQNAARPTDAYGRAKLAAEDAVRASGIPFIILRPVVVYGDGVKGNLAALMRLAALRIPLPFGAFNNRRSLVSLDNLVAAIDFVIGAPQAFKREHDLSGKPVSTFPDHALGETFLVADREPVSLAGLIRALRHGMGHAPGLVPVPPVLVKAGLAMAGGAAMWPQLAGEQVADPAKLIAAGWTPRPSALEKLGANFSRER